MANLALGGLCPKVRGPELPIPSAAELRNGISRYQFCRKCARGARLLAISRGRDRAFFCSHSFVRRSLSWKDEDGKISVSYMCALQMSTVGLRSSFMLSGLRRRENSSANNGSATIFASL
jgi:hypothetical protein